MDKTIETIVLRHSECSTLADLEAGCPLPKMGRFELEGFAGTDVTFDPWPSGWHGHAGLVGYTWAPANTPLGFQAADPIVVIRTAIADLVFDHGRRRIFDLGQSVKCRFWRGEVLYSGTTDGAIAALNELRPATWPPFELAPLGRPTLYDRASDWRACLITGQEHK